MSQSSASFLFKAQPVPPQWCGNTPVRTPKRSSADSPNSTAMTRRSEGRETKLSFLTLRVDATHKAPPLRSGWGCCLGSAGCEPGRTVGGAQGSTELGTCKKGFNVSRLEFGVRCMVSDTDCGLGMCLVRFRGVQCAYGSRMVLLGGSKIAECPRSSVTAESKRLSVTLSVDEVSFPWNRCRGS